MPWKKLRTYSRNRQAQRNVHCASPVPTIAASTAVGRRHTEAKTPQLCLDLRSKRKRESHAQSNNSYPGY